MTQRKSTAPNPFSTAVNTELRILMAKRGMNQTQLVQASGISQPVISRTIYNNESVLNTNQLDALCEALGEKPYLVLRRAEDSLYAQAGYALAAESDDQPRIDEGDMEA